MGMDTSSKEGTSAGPFRFRNPGYTILKFAIQSGGLKWHLNLTRVKEDGLAHFFLREPSPSIDYAEVNLHLINHASFSGTYSRIEKVIKKCYLLFFLFGLGPWLVH